MQRVATSAGQLFESSLFIEDFNSFVRSMPLMLARAKGGGETPPERFDLLRADRVTFIYPSRDEPSLKELTVEVRAGEVVALVGENGSGNTTLAKLLAGLYRPDAGTLYWDGLDTASFDPSNGESGWRCCSRTMAATSSRFGRTSAAYMGDDKTA